MNRNIDGKPLAQADLVFDLAPTDEEAIQSIMEVPPHFAGPPVYTERGGFQTYGSMSGMPSSYGPTNGFPAASSGGDYPIASGTGRLNQVIIHQPNVSGTTIIRFYDGASVALSLSGGPIATSGHKPLFEYYGYSGGYAPGTSGGWPVPTVFNVDVPFTSGLWASQNSGIQRWTAVFSYEKLQQ
jgi:hypothetical protein